MKLLRIGLSLLLLLSPIACASVQEITPNVISNTKYGMEFREVQKTLDAQGDLILKWVEGGKHYFVMRYLSKPRRVYYMLFKDDIFVALIQEYNFYKACEKHVGKLPFEDGFEPLYAELVAKKVSIKSIEFLVFREEAKREEADKESANLFEEVGYATQDFFTSPFWVPLLVGASPFYIMHKKKHEKFQNKFDKLSIGTSKETVIELLGQPKLSRKSIESDYEILIYRYKNVIGLRGGKLEWTFNCGWYFMDDIVYRQFPLLSVYEQLLKSVEFQDPKARETIEENIKEGKKTLEDNE